MKAGRVRYTCAGKGLPVALLALACMPTRSNAADAPRWAIEVASTPSRSADTGASAAVLLDRVSVSMAADGQLTTRRQYAVRVLTTEAARSVAVQEMYLTETGRVTSLHGWRILKGASDEVDHRDISDVVLGSDEDGSDVRARMLKPSGLDPGMVFAVESEVVDRRPFPQFEWVLQDVWPVHHVQRSLTLPTGWDARALTFNHADAASQHIGSTWTWELDDLPALVDEIAAVSSRARAARLAVTYGPGAVTALDDWQSVSRWLYEVGDLHLAPSDTLIAKARALTVDAPTALERIRLIAGYVQRVQYISIPTSLGEGGGYRPRRADDVLAKNYGDCKDKANLMRALLDALGIRSHLVALQASDPDYVRPEWASLHQFNHCILAIEVGIDVGGSAVVERDAIGRVLFFDPSDAATPVGELPRLEWNTPALLVFAAGAPLTRLPSGRADWQTVTRRVEVMLGANDVLTFAVQQIGTGSPASDERRRFDAVTAAEYLDGLDRDIQRQLPAARVTSARVDDDQRGNRFQLTAAIEAPDAARRLKNGSLLVTLVSPFRWNLPVLPSARRQTAVVLPPMELHDRVTLAVPDGFQAGDVPAPTTVTSPFGQVTLSWQVDGDRVTRDLTLHMLSTAFPADEYDGIRGFLDDVRDAEHASIVLTRRGGN